MQIPKIRDRLHEIAECLDRWGHAAIAKELHFLADETRRRKYLRKRDPYSPKKWKTKTLVKGVRALKAQGMSNWQIMRVYPEIPNQGRITDMCRGTLS
jgi:hypothetical protein